LCGVFPAACIIFPVLSNDPCAAEFVPSAR
jgi:hypothetical protein